MFRNKRESREDAQVRRAAMSVEERIANIEEFLDEVLDILTGEQHLNRPFARKIRDALDDLAGSGG
jgi:hypothetical protein